MPQLSFDFGLLIAYFVPGFIVLFGLRYWLQGVNSMLKEVDEKEHRVISTFTVLALAIVLGMMVSIVRFGVIDRTFGWRIPFSDVTERPQLDSIKREDPDYSKFIQEGHLKALLLVEQNDKRPYQFYGNTLLAIILSCLAWVTQEPRTKNKTAWNRRALRAGLALAVCAFILYPASRLSYYRYNTAVQKLNALPPASAKGP